MTTAELTLQSKNWTGLTLAELISAGRVNPTPTEILPWVTEACGEPTTMAEYREYRSTAYAIASCKLWLDPDEVSDLFK